MKRIERSDRRRPGALIPFLCVLGGLLWAHCSWGEDLSSSGPENEKTEVAKMIENIHWLGHDSFRIEGDGQVIYIDPYQLQGEPPKGDLILITHDHHDHCSPDDIAMVRKEGSVVVTIAAAASKLPEPVRVVGPGDSLTVNGIAIQAVPAYNVNKFRSPGNPFHPKEAKHVGYVVEVEGRRIYHTGDSDVIPEMESVETEVALLPVSGTYVMTAEEAVEAAALIQPKVAIPMHVGAGIGELGDAERFKEQASVPVEVLPLEK